MKSNDSTQIVTLSNGFIKYLKEKRVTDDLRKLMVAEGIFSDEHAGYDGEYDSLEEGHDNCDCDKIIDTVVRLCESNGKITPRNTVEILEKLLLDADDSLNPCFFFRYISCLNCSCKDADERYIQDAVSKLKLIMGNMDCSDAAIIVDSYIACLSRLSRKQEPAQAKITILELKAFGDEADAWGDFENLNYYCLALISLCWGQSRAGDIQGAYETLKILEDIVNANSGIDNITMFRCYANSLHELCGNDDVSISETFEMTQRLEKLLEQTQQMENDGIAEHYIAGLAHLYKKQYQVDMTDCCKKTYEQVCSIAEDARYKNNDRILFWYASVLLLRVDDSNLDDVRSTFKKVTEIASRSTIMEDELIAEHYDRIKQMIKNLSNIHESAG